MPDIAIETAIRTLPYPKSADVSRSSIEEPEASNPNTDSVVVRQVTSENATKETAKQEAEEPPPKETTLEAVEKLQTYTDRLDRNLEFSVDDSSGRTVVTVRDGSTEEVIRQIPSEEALRLASGIDSGHRVSFVDSHA